MIQLAVNLGHVRIVALQFQEVTGKSVLVVLSTIAIGCAKGGTGLHTKMCAHMTAGSPRLGVL